MATLTGVSISSSYTSLLKLDGNTDSTAAGNGSNAIQVKTGDNEATPLFLNTDRVGIGVQPYSPLHIKSDAEGSIGGLEATDGTFIPQVIIEGSGTTAAKMSPTLALFNSSTGADGDTLGSIMFIGGDDSNQPPSTIAEGSVYAGILAKITDETNSSNDGELHFLATSGNDNTNTAMSIVGNNVGIGISPVASQKLHVKASSDINFTVSAVGSALRVNAVNDAADATVPLEMNSSNTKFLSNVEIVGTKTLNLTNNTTDDNDKNAVITHSQYDSGTETEGFLLMQGFSNSSTNRIDIGGGNSQHNATEEIKFHTAANATTATGTARMVIDNNSRISLSNNDSGTSNTIFGKSAGANLDAGSNYNVFIGEEVSDAAMDDATNNVGVGYQSLSALTQGDNNIALGYQSSDAITTGSANVAIGTSSLGANTTAHNNVAVGTSVLQSLNTSSQNTAIGSSAMSSIGTNASGLSNCVAIGYQAFQGSPSTTNGAVGTVAIGMNSLTALTTGASNTAVGYKSGENLTTGGNSVMIGNEAGNGVSTSFYHVLIGDHAGHKALSDHGSVAVGYYALANATSGGYNTAIGYQALEDNVSGENSTALGYQSLANATGGSNTAIGYQSGDLITSGTNNTLLGSASEVSANSATNQTVIGQGATGQADNSVTLGNASVTSVFMGQDSGATAHGAGVRMGGDSTYTNEFKISAAEVIARFRNDNNNFNGHGILIQCGKDSPASAGDNVYMLFQSGDGDGHGGIRNSSTVANPEFFNGSDLRMKKDVSQTNIKGLDTINAIPLKEWNWNNEKEIPKTNIGIVADDLEKVLPELVSENTPLKGWEHCVKDGEKPLKTIPTESQLTLILMKAVQELSAKVEELEKK